MILELTNGKMDMDFIEGFDYEPGYIYLLTINVRKVNNPPADGSATETRLIKVNSKVKIADGTTFELPLSIRKIQTVSGNSATGFKFASQINIDCGNLWRRLYPSHCFQQ
jgi:hypothetical protein